MAGETRNNDGTRRAAAQSAALLNARNQARRASQDAGGAERPQERRGRHRADDSDSRRADYRRTSGGRRDSEPPRPSGKQSTVEFIKRNSTYIISVVGVVLIVVLMIIFIHACTPEEKPVEQPAEQGYVSSYDWSKLDTTNGRYAYVVDGQVKSRLGVDVSENQQWIDWKAVKADGIDFAIIRLGYRGATEGELFVDDYFEYNFASAREAGLDCGVYFFSQAVTEEEAREEARFVIEQLKGTKLQCPVAFDSEVVSQIEDARTAGLTDAELSKIADAFCDTIEAAGYSSLVYGNAYDLRSYDYDALNGRGIWWAEFDAQSPSHYTDISIWQYANGGQVNGIDTAVDMNLDLSKVLS